MPEILTGSETKPEPDVKMGLGPTLLVGKDFRNLYWSIVGFLFLVGGFLCGQGFYNLYAWRNRNPYLEERPSLASAVLYIAGGVLVMILALTLRQLRNYLVHVREETVAKIKSVELSKLREEDFEKVDEILQIRDEKAQADYERNRSDAFLITSFEMRDVDFFGDCRWEPRPGVNVLLGRNGYGKSLILRSVAALLQKNIAASGELFYDKSNKSFLQLDVQRNGKPETIQRISRRFASSSGQIPILAIPDSRFVSRNNIEIKATVDEALDLGQSGAKHFLEHLPYGEMLSMLFTEMCLDYWEKRSFDQPGFRLLEASLETLTGDQFRFDSVERVGRTAFHLFVITEGNPSPYLSNMPRKVRCQYWEC